MGIEIAGRKEYCVVLFLATCSARVFEWKGGCILAIFMCHDFD